MVVIYLHIQYWKTEVTVYIHYRQRTMDREIWCTISISALCWLAIMQMNCCMMTSSNGHIFRVTGPLWGESTGHRWIPITKASDAELWFFVDLRVNKQLSKQSRRWWLETPLSRYFQPIRAIFDRDIMRAYDNYISEIICHISVMWCCQQNSV